MRKITAVILVLCLFFTCTAYADVSLVSVGESSVTLDFGNGVDANARAIVAKATDEEASYAISESIAPAGSEGEQTFTFPGMSFNAQDKLNFFLWEADENGALTMRPLTSVFEYEEEEEEEEIWYSDNQINNNSKSIAYHYFDPLIGDYSISFKLTVVENGDNAVLIGDSSNGDLVYASSSAILLFNADTAYNFAVRSGNGSGSYTTGFSLLCPAKIGKTYLVSFDGNITKNTYTVSVTDENNATVTSGEITARTNGQKLDTIAFINNGKNTSVAADGSYSGYRFYAGGFAVEGETSDEGEEAVYSGFSGRYYAIKVGDAYLRNNDGSITADLASAQDESAEFLPRNMADGGFAFMCRSSSRRIAAAELGEQLKMTDYATNNLTQHWILEESENYTAERPAYYLRSMYNDLYAGLSEASLLAVEEAEKVEFIFEPLNDRSPLYLVSQTNAYARLGAAKRARLEAVYESVAGDVFGRFGVDTADTARIHMDSVFDEVLNGGLTESEQYRRLNNLLNANDGYLVEHNGIAYYRINQNLPGTEGLYTEIDEGVIGTYDFWSGSMRSGRKHNLRIYRADGSLEQSMEVYVQDDNYAIFNSDLFVETIVHIPYTYRRYIERVKICNDSASTFNCGARELFVRVPWRLTDYLMDSYVCHELHHSLDSSNGTWSGGSGWSAAMSADMFSATSYSSTSNAEDFADFGRMYILSCGNQDRQKALQILFPNRYASYYRFRHNNLGGFSLWDDTEYLEY